MQLEAGKFYRTRDGRKVGPMRDWKSDDTYHFHTTKGALSGNLWAEDGRNYMGQQPNTDLVAEWSDGPVRLISRKELVPGTYGNVEIFDDASAAVNDLTDVPALRESIRLLNEIADALDAE